MQEKGVRNCLAITVFVVALLFVQQVAAQTAQADSKASSEYATSETVLSGSGALFEKITISGSPTPPPGYELEDAACALHDPAGPGANMLEVPAYTYLLGCAAAAAGMIAAYYDRNGYPDIYTGPANGGVMPLDGSWWGTWTDGNGSTYQQNPLIASQSGVDGRAERGSIEDYWVAYQSTTDDPYITGGWTQHAWGDAIGDYMKTSQSAYGNQDSGTHFVVNGGSPVTCDEMYSEGHWSQDGTYGRKLFYEARGYTVTDCYSQLTDNRAVGGFSFARFKAEINAGHPVMLNLGGAGHTIAGIGYEDVTHTVYIHNGWIEATRTMTWGGSYYGMPLESVSIVNLDDDATPDAFTFVDQTGVAVNQVITSNTITVAGINPDVAVSISGGEYRINSGPWTAASGTVSSGDSVTVRQISAPIYPVTTDAVLTIGGVSDTFSVTTAADDTTPDAFTFVDQTGASLSTLEISNTIAVAGINLPADISISGGEYRINSRAWTAASGTVSSGDSVTVRQTSAPIYPVTTAAVLTIGGVSDTFSVTTRDFEVKILPRSLGWFLGEQETSRCLLVIGPKGTVFDDTTAVRWENSGIKFLSKCTFFERFMVMRASIDGAALGKGDYWCQIGTCGGTLTLVK